MDVRRFPFQCQRVQIYAADYQTSGSSWNCRGQHQIWFSWIFSEDTTLTLTLTSFRCLELQRGAGRPLPPAVVDPDVEQVEAEGVEARQQAAGAIPTEVQDVLLRVVAVVSVQAALFPVIHLRHGGSVSMKGDDNLWI